MEYVQMTLDDWVQIKQKLKQELLGVKQSFVRIGYALRQIDDQKLYEGMAIKAWQNSPRRNMDWNHPLQAVL